jgi:RecB family endonuclease NucS
VRIYSVSDTKLIEVPEEQFPLERHIQKSTEANLDMIFLLEIVNSEFDLHGLQIDTLAFDKASTFVIIEYKKDRNVSILDLLTV